MAMREHDTAADGEQAVGERIDRQLDAALTDRVVGLREGAERGRLVSPRAIPS